MWLLTQKEHVFLFVPNLIGYARVALGLISFYFFPSDPLYAMVFYGSSCLLDALDGTAARRLGQSMSFPRCHSEMDEE
jgi:CDP-diacylglycerol--inositol 3-phosphatidyltransferase